ncbi:interleukin-1 beta-like [Rhineura floridana]|uniref:interleukin-1 beta-like n=1 Tax=Rhineura floridana TaxID=261503 RepID=UPI002AC82D62|nr:interleukin-1 beta-like [Rhineura floridana]
MARVPDVLLPGCFSEEEEEEVTEFRSRNEVSFYDSAHRPDNLSMLKSVSPEHAASLKPSMELRRQRRHPGRGRPFADADLSKMLNSNLVEDLASFAEAGRVSAGIASVYTNVGVPQRYRCIQDPDNKSFYLDRHQGQAQLLAVHLPASYKPAMLDLHIYHSPLGSDVRRGRPVAVDIVGSELYLSCLKDGERCRLQLQEPEKPLEQISGKDMKFLFYYQNSSNNTSATFESVAHPGWYVATSKLARDLVRMHNHTGEQFYTDFYLFEYP